MDAINLEPLIDLFRNGKLQLDAKKEKHNELKSCFEKVPDAATVKD